MKLLLVTKPFVIEPLGLMYIASSVKIGGHEVEMALTDENLDSKVAEYKPDVIGYSIMTGDQQFYDDINKRLKRRHSFVSVAGGPHPTFFPEVLEMSSFDAICLGEGETAMLQFMNNPQSTQTPNFWFKDNGKTVKNPVGPLVNLDSLPHPDREVVYQFPGIKDGPIKHFIASKGCPYNCTYCFNQSYAELYRGKGKRVRFRSVDDLIDEVTDVVSSSPTKLVYFQDDTFILNKEWLREFTRKYGERVGLPFHCHTRANLVDEEVVDNLRRAGCYSVHIAAEAGNEDVRRMVLNRAMTNEQIEHAVELLKGSGMRVMLQNILGLPFTTLDDDFATLELNIRCQPDYAWASIFQPYPRTWLGEECVRRGVYTGDFSDIGDSFFEQSVIDIPHKNEVANLQKLFAIAVAQPRLYYSGELERMIKLPYKETREKYVTNYKEFRKKADKILYGVEI